MLSIGYILLFCYGVFISISIWGWLKAVSQQIIVFKKKGQGLDLDVIVPFRNEETNLKGLLMDISAQEKGSLEHIRFIFVDDHSEDEGRGVIASFEDKFALICIKNQGEGKKAALETAMAHCATDLVLFWDADIRIGPSYFIGLNALDLKAIDMCILPVVPRLEGRFWQRYAVLDFLSLIGTTFSWAALRMPIMVNAANMLISRKYFQVDTAVSSGDDMFTLHRIKSMGGKVTSSLDRRLEVFTSMPADWNAFLDQRMRWAAKSSDYTDKHTLIIGWSMVLINSGLLLLMAYLLFIGLPQKALQLFLFKSCADLLFLLLVSMHFRLSSSLIIFPLAALVNMFMFPLIFIASRTKSFAWKGRTFKK